MRISDLHVQMHVKHPQHGAGVVKAINEQTVQVLFEQGLKQLEPSTLELDQVNSMVQTGDGALPLAAFVESVVIKAAEMLERLESERKDVIDQLGLRWREGVVIMKPADASLQAKELPLEKFFHKIVMMRDNLRVLEQKLNSHKGLADADKVELQQYITRCYGSMTSFNIFFKDKGGQFSGQDASTT